MKDHIIYTGINGYFAFNGTLQDVHYMYDIDVLQISEERKSSLKEMIASGDADSKTLAKSIIDNLKHEHNI